MADCKYRLKEKIRQLWRKIGIEEEAIAVADEISEGNTDVLKTPSVDVLTMFYQFGEISTPIAYMASEFGITAKTLRKYFNCEGSPLRKAFEQGLLNIHSSCMGAMKGAIKNGDWRAADCMLSRLDNSRIRMESDEDEQKTAQLELKLPDGFLEEYTKCE